MNGQTLSIVRVDEICKWQARAESERNRRTADDRVKINRERQNTKHAFFDPTLLSAPFPGHDMEAETRGARYTSNRRVRCRSQIAHSTPWWESLIWPMGGTGKSQGSDGVLARMASSPMALVDVN
jgi:hypothetical protein